MSKKILLFLLIFVVFFSVNIFADRPKFSPYVEISVAVGNDSKIHFNDDVDVWTNTGDFSVGFFVDLLKSNGFVYSPGIGVYSYGVDYVIDSKENGIDKYSVVKKNLWGVYLLPTDFKIFLDRGEHTFLRSGVGIAYISNNDDLSLSENKINDFKDLLNTLNVNIPLDIDNLNGYKFKNWLFDIHVGIGERMKSFWVEGGYKRILNLPDDYPLLDFGKNVGYIRLGFYF